MSSAGPPCLCLLRRRPQRPLPAGTRSVSATLTRIRERLPELQSGGRNSKALYSNAVIADGLWHRVGFTWDGKNRILYVDGTEAAQDTQSGLTGSTGNMTLGVGSSMMPTTFWSGLIADMRIYNRVVRP